MIKENFNEAVEISNRIKRIHSVVDTIERIKGNREVYISNSGGNVQTPQHLTHIFIVLLEDYYKSELERLEKEFENL